jgi:hypothetical protein
MPEILASASSTAKFNARETAQGWSFFQVSLLKLEAGAARNQIEY